MIIVTDLDGTLLDHHSYSYDPAKPALKRIQQLDIPLILVTSKTVSEVESLRLKLNNTYPFIVENGSALIIPLGYFPNMPTESLEDGSGVLRFSPPYNELLEIIENWRTQHGFKLQGFGDWSASDVTKHTGLSITQATQAKQRLGSEPFLWLDSDEAFSEFNRLVENQGLRCIRGGRFYHLLGQADKAIAVKKLLEFYRDLKHVTPEVIALGDSPNDLQMLQMANLAIVIRKHDNSHMQYTGDNEVVFTQGIGPAGWNEAILQLLTD